MNGAIERPIYYEGQILGAADLEADGAHARGQMARHERYLHLWGVAYGLGLGAKKQSDAAGTPYQDITLGPGVAIDGTGREIVVADARALSEDLFDQLNVAIEDEAAWYPVFLVGRDAVAQSPAQRAGGCGSTEANRVAETYDISFGHPGDETALDDPPAVTDGPGGGASGWPVLLGYVQWNGDINKFTDVSLDSGATPVRYAGVSADVVAARHGALTLRTGSANEAGKPALILNEADGGKLEFGLLTEAGQVTPLASVNAKGDLTIAGKLKGAVAPGSVQIQSGMATDGMQLPLPPGITQQQVDDGKVVVHLHVTPHTPGSPAPTPAPDNWGAFPLECTVDATSRRVKCSVRWFRITAIAQPPVDRGGLCDYTVLASVPAASGGAS